MKTSEELERSIKAVWAALDDVSASQQAWNADMRARINSRVIVPDQELPNEQDVQVRHSDVLRASECAELATLGAQILALEPKPEYSEEDDLRRSWAAWDFIARHLLEGSQYERERDRQDLFEFEPLEGSFPPINDGNQEALRQLTQEP